MPSCLDLQFLGLPQIRLNDNPIIIDRRKALALLAYLAVNDTHRARPRYSREALSAVFWPNHDQARAFSNLRTIIWEVHRTLGEGWLIADRESVHLSEEARIELDVTRFHELISQCYPHAQCDSTLRIPLFLEATKLYRNHFLTGFSLKDAYPFNEWAFAQSEDLRRRLAVALTALAADYCALGRADQAIPHARRRLSLDPLDEAAHRQLMEIYLQAGQHGAALKQYQTCEKLLRKELNLDPQPETYALYRNILKREAKPSRLEKTTEGIRPNHNLPGQLSFLIGREKEKEEITTLIANNRLVTLVGAGGMGKTRLALHVGEALMEDYQDGVWFVPLDSLPDPELVPQTVANVFNIREGPHFPVIELLINVLREKTILLILDSCEHLLEACTSLTLTLLQSCLNLRILATSREVMNMEGEAAYYLPSLSMPPDHSPLEKLTQYESVQLFIQRAALAHSHFKMTHENAQAIADICRRAGGIPLGIELAAAHIHVLRTSEILKHLNESFTLLASDSRVTLPRHQTMRASLDWSWSLLTASEQVFLRQLSILAGGWTLESAQAICGGNAMSLISALVKKSLIIVDRKSSHQTRYHFHDIVRQYMHEKLFESGEEANIRTRHLQYFLQVSTQAEPALRGPTQLEWITRLNDECDNIRVALEWADKTDIEAGLYLSGRLHRFWERFDLRQGVRWLTRFIEKPESRSYPQARAKALCTQAWILVWTQEFNLARRAAQECLDLYRAAGDESGEIDGLLAIGLPEPTASKAIGLHQRALSLSRSLGDQWREAQALVQLSWSDNHHHYQKIAHLKEAVTLFRQLGDLESATEQMISLGHEEVINGNVRTAQKWLDEASRASLNLNSTGITGDIFDLHGTIALIRGDYETARAQFEKAAAIAESLGNRWSLHWIHARLGYVALHEGNWIEAREIFADIAQRFQKDQFANGIVYALEGIASLNAGLEKPERAARLIGWADATREAIGDTRPMVENADLDKIIAACRVKMGKVAFSDAYKIGQTMTVDEAVAYALIEKE